MSRFTRLLCMNTCTRMCKSLKPIIIKQITWELLAFWLKAGLQSDNPRVFYQLQITQDEFIYEDMLGTVTVFILSGSNAVGSGSGYAR